MKLLLIVSTFPTVSETFIFRKAVGLARQGFDVEIIAFKRGDWTLLANEQPLPQRLKVNYLVQFSLPNLLHSLKYLAYAAMKPSRFLQLIGLCLKAEKSPRPIVRSLILHLPFVPIATDIIHFEFLGLATTFSLLGQLINAPTIVSSRGSELHLLEQQSLIRFNRVIALLQTATAIHCVSEEMAREVANISGRETGLWINRPAVEVARISAKLDYQVLNLPRIISVGRLVWIKGFDYLLQALAIIKRAGIPFCAEIIGPGELYEKLQIAIHELGLEDMVCLVGGLSPTQVWDRLLMSDIFACSSHSEGISNSVLEAMASGLPIVTTDVGGMTEAVTNGIEGYVVPARNFEVLAERLIQLLRDSELRAKMGKAARQRVEADYSIQRQVDVFRLMYEAVVTGVEEDRSLKVVSTVLREEPISVSPDNIIQVVSIMPLIWESGLEYAIDAVALARHAGANLQYRIIGTGPYREALLFAARQWGLWKQGIIDVLETEDQVEMYIQNANILLDVPFVRIPVTRALPSLPHGIQLLVNDNSDYAHNIPDDVNNTVVETFNATALASQLIKMAADLRLGRVLPASGV